VSQCCRNKEWESFNGSFMARTFNDLLSSHSIHEILISMNETVATPMCTYFKCPLWSNFIFFSIIINYVLSYYIKFGSWTSQNHIFIVIFIFCECVGNIPIPIACKILSNKKISAINSAALSNSNGNHVINFINKISFGNILNSRKRNIFFYVIILNAYLICGEGMEVDCILN